jgi:hypothetical protein
MAVISLIVACAVAFYVSTLVKRIEVLEKRVALLEGGSPQPPVA